MLAKEEELVKVKERQLQTEEQLKEYESKQQQVGASITIAQAYFKSVKVDKSRFRSGFL